LGKTSNLLKVQSDQIVEIFKTCQQEKLMNIVMLEANPSLAWQYNNAEPNINQNITPSKSKNLIELIS
jgi:hypothetical protein